MTCIRKTPSLEQIDFRREKLAKVNDDMERFKQECPMTIEEFFQSSDQSILHKDLPAPDWEKVSPELHLLSGHPQRNRTYILNAHVGGEKTPFNSVIQIIDMKSCKKVGEWISNHIAADDFCKVLAAIGRAFNNAYISIDANNNGMVALKKLRKIYPSFLIYKKTTSKPSNPTNRILNFGLLKTPRTGPPYIEILRNMLDVCLTRTHLKKT
jgi:hypothetical protein